MAVTQQTVDCSDFDVTLPGEGSPAFRVLVPERVIADGYEAAPLHTIRGTWERNFGLVGGRFIHEHTLEITVLLMPGERDLRISLTIMNIGETPLDRLRADICSAVNHLPGEPGWANAEFMPDTPLDRNAQGAYWYETVTPKGMTILTTGGDWHSIHPHPDRPSAASVPPYGFEISHEPVATACAVHPHGDESSWFFQAWDHPGHTCTPFPGNACMHLHPVIADRLEPGASATVHGVTGLFSGSRDALARHIGDSLA